MNRLPPTRVVRSLRGRILLLALMVCLLLVSALTGFFLLLRQTQSAMLGEAQGHLVTVVRTFANDYLSAATAANRQALTEALAAAPGSPTDDLLSPFTVNAFRRDPGIEGGFYSSATGNLLGYAFPTNDGPGPKQDIPPRERPTILSVAERAATTARPASQIFRGQRDVILFQAVPLVLDGRTLGSVWGMQRIHDVDSSGDVRARFGLSCLALAAMACAGVAFRITRTVQADVTAIQKRLHDLELDLNQPSAVQVSASEMNGILTGIDRLGASLQQKIEKERQLVDQLHHKERLAALGQVAAGVAHELRNPLATIHLRAQMSLRSKNPEQLDRSAKLTLEEIDRLSAMLDRLLYFAKPIQLQRRAFSLAQLCQDLLASLGPEAEQAGIKLQLHTTGNTDMVADGLKLRQVVENLIRNAMEAFGDAVAPMQKTVAVSLSSTSHQVRLTVVDNGPGLDPNVAARVFHPFFTTKARGTGLGLSIAQEIVRAHDGTLTLQNAEGFGTMAEVVLPCLLDEQNQEAVQSGGAHS